MRELNLTEIKNVSGAGPQPLTDVSDPNDPVNTGNTGGSLYGGGWVALGPGASVSGGGGTGHGSGGVGLGLGYFIGYSSDSEVSDEQAEIDEAIIGVGIANVGLVFDFDPFTVGVSFGVGGYVPIAERSREH